MSEREKVRAGFVYDVKGLCANLATDLLKPNYNPSRVVEHFEMEVKRLFVKRDEDLAELEEVKVKRHHLRVLVEWFVKAVKSHKERDARKALGRNPGCFGTAYPDKYCSDKEGWGDELCQACVAISPLLKED